MEDHFNIKSLYYRLLNYQAILQSIIGKHKNMDSILLNEEQKAAIVEGEELIKEVKKKIKELESVLGIGENPANA